MARRPSIGGRPTRSESLELTLALAIAELTSAEREADMDRMRERVALARGHVAEALDRLRKAKAPG